MKKVKNDKSGLEGRLREELELVGINERDLQEKSEIEKYELLMDCGLMPEDYQFLFQNYICLRDNLECYRMLRDAGIDAGEFEGMPDSDKLRGLVDHGLNAYEFDVFFENCRKMLREYDREMLFLDAGLEYGWFCSLSDIEKVEKLIIKGLDPFEFIDEYSDYQTALQKADDIQTLAEAGISYFSFLWRPDGEKLDELMQVGLSPYRFSTYFEDPARIESEYERRSALRRCHPVVDHLYMEGKTDEKRAEILLKEGLLPEDYPEFFDDFALLSEVLDDIKDRVYR